MKTNLQYIFDKIRRQANAAPDGAEWDKAALVDLATVIGAADRGVAVSSESASRIAETVIAARGASDEHCNQLRAQLNDPARPRARGACDGDSATADAMGPA